MNDENITLAAGSGGAEMKKLIESFVFARGNWKNFDDDSATLQISKTEQLVFTTDSFIVSPIFFPNANIGHLAFAGTVNDLCVMGAKPLGLSLGLIIEEGFPAENLQKIIATINELSRKYNVPIVTGDTKVMERGKIDGIVINTAGIGIVKNNDLLTKKITAGDKIIISGGIGEHAVALLSKRFDYQTNIVSDSKPLINEINAVRSLIKYAKDPTRGGIASILNEIAEKNGKSKNDKSKEDGLGILLQEESIPAKSEVRKVCEMLGINLYELACEGRFVCIASKQNATKVVSTLKKFNKDAAIIGEIVADKESRGKVVMQTFLGKRILPIPSGRIVPRIC